MVVQLVKKFPTFVHYYVQKSLTMLPVLSHINLVHNYKLSILILPFQQHLGLPGESLPLKFINKKPECIFLFFSVTEIVKR